MNKLPLPKRVRIIRALCEGNSLRSTARMEDVSFNTVIKLLIDVGRACLKFHEQRVHSIAPKHVQADEVWGYIGKKTKSRGTVGTPSGPLENHRGDIWTWVAIDSDTRLIITWVVGHRDIHTARLFVQSLYDKTICRFQLTTDGLTYYARAIDETFGAAIDYAQRVKTWDETSYDPDRRYSIPCIAGTITRVVSGNPDLRFAHTNHIERYNLTMRMCMRRYTRLTNAFSKKVENHIYALALQFVYYNFVRIHKVIRVTPAMEAGLADDVMSIEQLIHLADQKEISDLR